MESKYNANELIYETETDSDLGKDLWLPRGRDSKEINPEYSLQGLMLKLKLQYFGHLMQRANSLEKTLMLGKSEGKGRRG